MVIGGVNSSFISNIKHEDTSYVILEHTIDVLINMNNISACARTTINKESITIRLTYRSVVGEVVVNVAVTFLTTKLVK
jgi:AAA15 family ATPase/GTPase